MQAFFSKDHPYFRLRFTIFISLLVVTPIGFASKFYHGSGSWWVNDYFGGMLYEVFWILVLVLFWPKISTHLAACAVFVVTSLLETLQLWHPPFLQLIRANFWGRTLIGTSFVWWDFPHYVLGCFVGWLWLRFLAQKTVTLNSEKWNTDYTDETDSHGFSSEV
ncbi:MAG: DUF2809 domain-containing protein [bacterium]